MNFQNCGTPVRTAIAHPFPAGFAPRSPQNKAGKLVKKHSPAPLNRRTFLTPPLCVCYTLDKLLKCTPALQHVCCRPLREGVGRNLHGGQQADVFIEVALYARAWVEIAICRGFGRTTAQVALYARAWVEIGPGGGKGYWQIRSPSTRGRG